MPDSISGTAGCRENKKPSENRGLGGKMKKSAKSDIVNWTLARIMPYHNMLIFQALLILLQDKN